MGAYLKLKDIPGQATDEGHKEWILIESMSMPIYRSIPAGAKDNERTQGDTTPGDVVVTRTVDKSSPKLEIACADGTFFKDATIHLTNQVNKKQETFYELKLSNVIISSYSMSANKSGDPLPHEDITLSYTEFEVIYHTIDPTTGENKGKVPAKYSLGKGTSS
jgi:type VI secretion system secreted protein Hcp